MPKCGCNPIMLTVGFTWTDKFISYIGQQYFWLALEFQT